MTNLQLPRTKAISVIIPTNLDARLEWLKHRLNILYLHGFRGETIVGVWAGHQKLEVLRSFCAELSPKINVISQDGALRATDRVLAMTTLISGKYVVQIGDDDFLLPDALENIAGVLDQDASIFCAQGRTLFINSDLAMPLSISPLPMWPALEPDVMDRYTRYLTRPGQLFCAMFRRADFIERYHWMEEAMAHTDNHVWFEAIGEFFPIIKGRVHILDEIFIVRGKDPKNTSRVVRAEGGQFPFFLLSDSFSTTYKFFEGQVFRLFASLGIDVEAPENRKVILTGLLNGIGAAAFGRRSPPPPEETQLLEMLQQRPVHPTLNRILEMIMSTRPAVA